MTLALLAADGPPELIYARSQMALSLGWHIVIACFGVAFPSIVLAAEWRARRGGDADLLRLARTWSTAMGVLFASSAGTGSRRARTCSRPCR